MALINKAESFSYDLISQTISLYIKAVSVFGLQLLKYSNSICKQFTTEKALIGV